MGISTSTDRPCGAHTCPRIAVILGVLSTRQNPLVEPIFPFWAGGSEGFTMPGPRRVRNTTDATGGAIDDTAPEAAGVTQKPPLSR